MKIKLITTIVISLFLNVFGSKAQCVTKDVNMLFCISESYLDKSISYMINSDLDAVQSLIDVGACSFIAPYVAVYVESSSWTGTVEIRPKGAISTVWTVREAIDCK